MSSQYLRDAQQRALSGQVDEGYSSTPKYGGNTIHAQTRPQKTPPAITDSEDMSRKRVCMIQHTGDMLAGHLDGRPSNVLGLAKLMHKECQGSRS